MPAAENLHMNGREQVQQKHSLLDQLVGAQEKRFGDRQAEGLGSSQINDEVEFGRLLDRDLARLRPVQNNLINIISGTVTPSAFAVLRLMTSSNLVGRITGSSAGFSPLRMRST